MVRQKVFGGLLAVFFVASSASATVLDVPDGFATIQSAIDAASNGDTVLVSDGNYLENITFLDKDIVVGSLFLVDGNRSHVSATVIDGSSPADIDTASCVRITGGQTRAAELVGFTLTGGTGTLWFDPPTNLWYREGGGILINQSSPRIDYNLILNNLATGVNSGATSAGGGGIRTGFGSPLIQHNTIQGNEGNYGAGIVVNFDDAEIRNNLILQNSGGKDFGGGGIWVYGVGHSATIENNTVYGNTVTGRPSIGQAKGTGGGILIWSTAAILRNNILWGNTAREASQINVISASVDYASNDIDGVPSDNGGITLNPQFDSSTHYLLMSGSPCIDGGYDDIAYQDPEDPQNPGSALYPAMGGLRGDIGAYGGPGAAELPQLVVSPVPETGAGSALPQHSSIERIYPNPFNPSTTIRWYLAKSEQVQLSVYDVLGREVAVLLSGAQAHGEGQTQFDASGLASGVYTVRLKTPSSSDTHRMMLVR